MATFYSNNYGGRYLKLTVWQDGGFAYWQLDSIGGSVNYYTIYNLSIKLNGVDAYSPGTVDWSTKQFPAAKGTTWGKIWIGNGASTINIPVSFVCCVYYNQANEYGGVFTMERYVWAPSLSNISITNVKDTSFSAGFSLLNANGDTPGRYWTDLSLNSDMSPVLQPINAHSATFTNLDPNRTYYVRGNATNGGGTTYTDTKSIKTEFYIPTQPGAPILSYTGTEPILSSHLIASWTASKGGSKPVAGYRLMLYKNNVQIKQIITENTEITYDFGTFESLNCEVGDTIKLSILSYSVDWQGEKFYSGTLYEQVYSTNAITIVSDKFIYVSQNGGVFDKKKTYISIDGNDFIEIKKEKFRTIN